MKNYISPIEIPQEIHQAAEMLSCFFTKNGLDYWRFRGITDSRLTNKLEREKEDLESAIRKFLNYTRKGQITETGGFKWIVPKNQIEELAESIKPPQRLQPNLPHTNQDHFPPQSQEPLPLDSRTEF